MILDELVVSNFGVYRGLKRPVRLTPYPGRPIVLFGALNGSGKTTLMEAMQLALYGKGARSASRGRLAYHDYLARTINRYTPANESTGVELAFRYWVEGRLEPIRLKRTWYRSARGIKEDFEVWRGNELDSVATERWAEFVEDIIPNQISDLFFFDGEKIEELADPEQSAALLRVGLHSLLGLDLVDHLVRSLGVLERKYRATQATSSDRAALQHLAREIAALKSQFTSLGNQLGEIETQTQVCANRLKKLEDELEKSGGNLYLQSNELKAGKERLNHERDVVAGELVELASGDAPLLLVGDLLDDLEEVVLQSLGESAEARFQDFIENRDKRLLKKLAQLGARASHIDSFRAYLEKTKPEMRKTDTKSLSLALTPTKLFTPAEEAKMAEALQAKVDQYDALLKRIADCERNLEAVPEEGAITGTLEALTAVQQELERLKMRKDILAEERRKLEADIARKEAEERSKLEEVACQQLAEKTTLRKLKHSARARETLGKYREEIAQSHMLRLGQLITECFARLHRKKLLKYLISVNRQSYELHLTEEGGHQVTPSELSAGERQLLAVSVLWALAQASGRKLPTVIDTPLGRLDSKHRHFLVDNYFPRASHQVILFSTDEEITRSYYERLVPAIGREYCIVFDEMERSSVVSNGYFKKEALAA